KRSSAARWPKRDSRRQDLQDFSGLTCKSCSHLVNPVKDYGESFMPNEIVEPVQSPFCGSLRSKKYYMLDRLATSADEYLDATNHVWCCETQEVIGPDNARVDPE